MENKNKYTTSEINEYDGLPILDSKSKLTKKGLQRGKNRLKLRSLALPDLKKDKSTLECTELDFSDKYMLMEKLGVGTYSYVRRAIHKETGAEYAAKISKGTTAWKLLKNEANILKVLSCNNIPKFQEFHEDLNGNKSYLVMELVKGISLDQYVQKYESISEIERRDFLNQLILAVYEINIKGIWHRDIKPQNILITEDKQLKLIDFNISKEIKERENTGESKFKAIFFTQIWSPNYAAPEINLSKCYNESIDIWGIGIAYFEMIYGIKNCSKPFTNTSYLDCIENIKENEMLSSKDVGILTSIFQEDPNLRPTIQELFDEYCD